MAEISLCMIVKNEEKVLGRCLESAKELASHEIVIEDEGKQEYKVSSDQEPENPDAEEMKEEVERRLAIAKDLYQEGTITKEEYEEKRKEILKEL